MGSFVAEESFWKLFPQASIGVVMATGMKSTSEIARGDVDEIATLLKRANVEARRHLTSDTISENEPVKAWREEYRRFKTKKGARCSVENLLKRVLKDKPVSHITPAVDIYNTVSLTYALPVGGEDLHAIEGDLRLTVSEGGDAFLPLGEDADDSTDAFFAIECVEPDRMEDCQAAIDRLAELLERYLGATIGIKTLVTRDNPRVAL